MRARTLRHPSGAPGASGDDAQREGRLRLLADVEGRGAEVVVHDPVPDGREVSTNVSPIGAIAPPIRNTDVPKDRFEMPMKGDGRQSLGHSDDRRGRGAVSGQGRAEVVRDEDDEDGHGRDHGSRPNDRWALGAPRLRKRRTADRAEEREGN
jgi:hypothetical protein